MEILMKITGKIANIADFIASIALTIMLLLMMIVVVGRYIFGIVPAWSEELALYLMSWLGFLSAASLEKNREHIRISIIEKVYPWAVMNICNTVRYIVKLIFSILLAYYGFILSMRATGYFASVEIPRKLTFIPGAVAGVIMTLMLTLQFKEEVVDIWKKPEAKTEVAK